MNKREGNSAVWSRIAESIWIHHAFYFIGQNEHNINRKSELQTAGLVKTFKKLFCKKQKKTNCKD